MLMYLVCWSRLGAFTLSLFWWSYHWCPFTFIFLLKYAATRPSVVHPRSLTPATRASSPLSPRLRHPPSLLSPPRPPNRQYERPPPRRRLRWGASRRFALPRRRGVHVPLEPSDVRPLPWPRISVKHPLDEQQSRQLRWLFGGPR